jgi:hypothetical protein
MTGNDYERPRLCKEESKTMPAKSSRRKVMRTKPKIKPTQPRTLDINAFFEVAKKTGPIRVLDSTIPCTDGKISHAESSTFIADSIITVNLPGGYKGPYLIFMTQAFGFGCALGLYSSATPTGFSFSGETLVCTADWVCTNGQKMICDVSVEGEVNTSSSPHELNYTYTLSVYCGNTLSCIEKGTYKGTRQSTDVGTGLEGDFVGTQTWAVDCCTSREKIPVPSN